MILCLLCLSVNWLMRTVPKCSTFIDHSFRGAFSQVSSPPTLDEDRWKAWGFSSGTFFSVGSSHTGTLTSRYSRFFFSRRLFAFLREQPSPSSYRTEQEGEKLKILLRYWQSSRQPYRRSLNRNVGVVQRDLIGKTLSVWFQLTRY